MTDDEKIKKCRWASGSSEAKMVKQLEREFNAKLDALKKVAHDEKLRRKKEIDLKLLKCLEVCKQHGGPITQNCIEKLEALDYDEVLAEIKFLKKTTAPQLRIRRKVDGKFIKYSREQLLQQIKDVLKPSDKADLNVEQLLEDALDSSFEDINSNDDNNQDLPPIGSVGFWKGPLEEHVIGVMVDSTTMQKYKESRKGYIPSGLPEDVKDWLPIETIKEGDYHYVLVNQGVYLLLDT